jgi:transcriptional regulator with XRE-family HTH domain
MLSDLSAWLREQRLARKWSAAEMGRQLHRSAKATGDHTVPSTAILISYVRRWEAGKFGLTERYQLHYCTALSIPPTQFGPRLPQERPLQLSNDPVALLADVRLASADAPPDTDPPIHSPWKTSGYRDARNGHDVTERTEQQGIAAMPLDQLTAAIADESLGFGEWVGMSEVADTTIEQYAGQARRLAKVFEYALSLPLLLETRWLRDRVASQLSRHQGLDQARDLYLIAAQVCGLLAWMTGDVGSYRAADTHAWTAWMCAEQAGHDGARAWVRATQAKLAYWDGRFVESAQLAEDGLGYASADSAHVFLALFRARALARMGRVSEAAGALGQAAAKRDRGAVPDLLGGVWELTPARYHGLLAGTRLLMDQPADTVAEASRAIELSQATPPGDRHLYAELLVRTDQARAHIQRSELDGAVGALRPVLDLATDTRPEPILQQLSRLRDSLALPEFASTPLALDLQDEIETYRRESITNAITG